jgi:hypothetical protein
LGAIPSDRAHDHHHHHRRKETGLLGLSYRKAMSSFSPSRGRHQGKNKSAQATRMIPDNNKVTWQNPTDSPCRIRVSKRTRTKNDRQRQRTASPDEQPPRVASRPRDIVFLPTIAMDVGGTALQRANPLQTMAPIPQQLSYPAPDISESIASAEPLIVEEEDSDNSNTASNKMMEEMNTAVNSLRTQLIEEKRLLFLQEAKIDRIENQILNVEVEYVTLHDIVISTAKASSTSGKESTRRERIDYLKAQIGALQIELAEEEAAMELEVEEASRHKASHLERTLSAEKKLGKMNEQREHLLLLRETFRWEASDIALAVKNTEAELMSLCEITRMAQREEL